MIIFNYVNHNKITNNEFSWYIAFFSKTNYIYYLLLYVYNIIHYYIHIVHNIIM